MRSSKVEAVLNVDFKEREQYGWRAKTKESEVSHQEREHQQLPELVKASDLLWLVMHLQRFSDDRCRVMRKNAGYWSTL